MSPSENAVSLSPIPLVIEPPNWARLPISECGESLVALTPEDAAYGLRFRSLYAEMGIPGAPETVFVRRRVYEMLRVAASKLPPHLALVVFDGYRPLLVQQFLWDDFSARIDREHAHLDAAARELLVRQYVAHPTADPACPPPHRSGGAVDVYIVDTATGERLPMGTEPDEVAEATPIRWFEEYPLEPFTSNRRLLFHAMAAAGFANYPGEWWHYDYGNQRWANITGAETAVYGIPQEP